MADIPPVSGADMLRFGLQLMGYVNRATGQVTINNCSRLPRFKAFFGPGPDTLAKIWNDLVQKYRYQGQKLDASYFLMTLFWFKGYDIDSKLAVFMKIDESTVRKYYLFYGKLIQAQKAAKIVWDENDNGTVFIGSVDGTHFLIEEPRTNPDGMWYFHKFNKPAYAYELVLSLYENKLIWVNGPFQAGFSDLHIFRAGLKAKIPNGKKMIADKGYIGHDPELCTPNDQDYPLVKGFKRRVRARQECYNARIKEFRILSDRFRHDLSKHQMVFEAVCVIVQYDVENERPLFEL